MQNYSEKDKEGVNGECENVTKGRRGKRGDMRERGTVRLTGEHVRSDDKLW